MPRKAREKSSTGIYHVILRGINGQVIFQDNEDYEKFIETIREYKEVSRYEIYAYCLMNNHIHLLMKEGIEEFGIVFRRIGAKYVYWYNQKYSRIGHLFQDRYKSEIVEDEKYLLTVLRYIHQNPVKAGIEKNISKYLWTSYNEYLGRRDICDIDFPLSIFGKDRKRSIFLFKEFNIQENDDQCLEDSKKIRLNDIEAIEIIKAITKVRDTKQIQKFQKEERNEVIKELKNKGLSIRQIERLTGVSFGVIRNIK